MLLLRVLHERAISVHVWLALHPKAQSIQATRTVCYAARHTVQFRQPDGKTLRGEFSPDSTLQELCHYIDARRTGER